jgi:hypothetical protein
MGAEMIKITSGCPEAPAFKPSASAINPVSFATTKIECYFNDTALANGTGFVFKWAEAYALVTNWHVLSGKHAVDNTCLSSTGGIPNRIKFFVTVSFGVTKFSDGTAEENIYIAPIEISLSDGEGGNPIWRDDRSRNPQSDIAIILLEPLIDELRNKTHDLRHITGGNVTLRRGVQPIAGELNYQISDLVNIYPRVGAQVFVVGYPLGIEYSGVMPIWKGGYIASEPAHPTMIGGEMTGDVLFVDTLSRGGMSGSPVIRLPQAGDTFITTDGSESDYVDAEPLLVGVYSGREGVTKNEADLALGRVWKVEVIERLIREHYDERERR